MSLRMLQMLEAAATNSSVPLPPPTASFPFEDEQKFDSLNVTGDVPVKQPRVTVRVTSAPTAMPTASVTSAGPRPSQMASPFSTMPNLKELGIEVTTEQIKKDYGKILDLSKDLVRAFDDGIFKLADR